MCESFYVAEVMPGTLSALLCSHRLHADKFPPYIHTYIKSGDIVRDTGKTRQTDYTDHQMRRAMLIM